jgi:hypothetical protein
VPDAGAGVAEPDVDDGADGAERSANEQRDITIAGVGRSWATRWSSLEAALREVAASC